MGCLQHKHFFVSIILIFVYYFVICNSENIIENDTAANNNNNNQNVNNNDNINKHIINRKSQASLLSGNTAFAKLHRNIRSSYGGSNSGGGGSNGNYFYPQQRMLPISRSKIPIELDLMVDDDDIIYDGKGKRYDDYGHMRFGKRGGGGEDQFDDYGHMRFGKRSDI